MAQRRIILADHAGFCFGVRRAVDAVYSEIETGESIYTFGPVIHNEIVVNDLTARGVRIISTPEEIDSLKSGTLIIRSHGVSREIYDRIRANRSIKLVDTTCPFVQRIHRIVEEQSRLGRSIVIIGNVGHAEVEGHIGWSSTPVTVIETREEAMAFDKPLNTPICAVAQTTFHSKKFEEFVAILKSRGYNIYVENTICNATEIRQQEAAEIASEVDIMIVIGGKNSSNSAKLYEICKKECARTFFIQSLEELDLKLTSQDMSIGITAGASTPKNIIEEVQRYVGTGTDI